ncbi:hypothetical protein UCRPC4_g05911 [Phaeomoniella chlamydospora]|uniref:glucan endo-1,3-beta-D-glucosidase n=1 Tax=Phaeomoniella chlamydospora TaxID=158046 RepID=A0A0G2E011_PHACM|nr:hypothetical protein UCRPC4_g05911 [Phaeomoniella chlamydospora]
MEQGECSSEAQVFNSSLGSIGSGNDLSWHFRGPLQLDQFAYYTLSSSTEKKRNLRPSFHERRHGHNVVYKRQVAREKVMEIEKRHIVEIQKRAVCDPVTVTFNGVAVSWLNLWNGYSNVPSSVCYHTATTTAKASTKASSATSTQPTTVVTNGRTTTITYTVVIGVGPAYIVHESNVDRKNSVGFAFLNHNGGQGSGVWDSEFGNSLSYASRDAERGSATPQIFDGHLEDGVELVVMSDKECGSDDFCGFSRPGTVAHQGFDNSEALFLMEFSMPITNKTGWNMDTPAIWILNAQIPRTLQYGKAECSCWSSGCGEMDIFEVLDAANTRMKSTWHGDDDSGGSSYWFKRPQTSRKAGVLFSESNEAVTIFYLPDDVDFSSDIDATAIVEWIGSAASDGTLFTL